MTRRTSGVGLSLALALTLCARAEDTPPFRRLPHAAAGVFACPGNTPHYIVSTRAQLNETLARLESRCAPSRFQPGRADLLRALDESSFRWEEEALVVVQDWYGTGMATASLELDSPTPDLVRATIRWKVPPPPVTPDATSCRFAFAVRKSVVTRVTVSGRNPDPVSLIVGRATTAN